MSVQGNSFGQTFVDWSDELYVQSSLLRITTVEPPWATTSH